MTSYFSHPQRTTASSRVAVSTIAAIAIFITGCPQKRESTPTPSPSPATTPVAATEATPAPEPTATPVATKPPAALTAADLPLPAQGAFEQAIFDQLKEARETALAVPDDAAAIGKLAMLYHAYDLLPQAVTAYSRAIELEPDAFNWHYLLGHALLRQDETDKAIEQLKRAIELKPDYATAQIILANVYAGRAEYKEALEVAVPVYEAHPDDPAVAYALGSYYLAGDDLVWAVEILKPLVDKHPQYGGVRAVLAEAFGRLGQNERADELMSQAGSDRSTPAMRDPELLAIFRIATGTDAERNKAIASAAIGNLDQAIAHFDKALSFSPDDRESLLGLADALAANGNAERAESVLSAMYEADATDTSALLRLGNLLLRQNRAADVKPLIERTAESLPDDTVVLGLRAKVAVMEGDNENALALLERLTNNLPDDGLVIYELAKAYARVSRLDDAEKSLRRANELLPTNQDVMKSLGDLYYAKGEQDAAIAWYRKAAREGALFPAPAMATIATDAFNEGDYTVGYNVLRRAVEAYPYDENLLDTLSRTLSMCPDPNIRNGKEALRIARELYGDEIAQIPIQGLVTLATAYGEAGDYEKAIDLCSEGMQRALESQDPLTYHRIEHLLRRYRDLAELNEKHDELEP